jgi:predicted RNase H-like HicB family nuclease
MIAVEKVLMKHSRKENDGTWVVKVEYETSSIYGYGKSEKEAMADASDILSSSYGRKIKVV